MNTNQQDTISKEVFYKTSLIDFERQLNGYLETLRTAATESTLKKVIQFDFLELCHFFIKMGNYVQSMHLNSENETDAIEAYLINYNIPDYFKATIILHRDVLLEINKLKILEKEQKHFGKLITSHFEKSRAVLVSQFEDLQHKISSAKTLLNKASNNKKSISRKLSWFQNPWTVYKNQFETLLLQFDDIEQSKQVLDKTVLVFNELKKVNTSISKNNEILNNQLQNNITHVLKQIDDLESHKELLFFIDEQLAHDITLGNDQEQLTQELNTKISQLEKIKAPISSEDGLLTIREIDLSKAVQKWFDYQILPEVMDLIAIETSLKSVNGISLTNFKNNLQLSKSTNDVESASKVKPNLTNLQNNLNELKVKGEIITKRINEKIESQLQVANIFREKSFLDVPFNSSINFNSNTLLNSLKKTINKSLSFFDAQLKKTKHLHPTSNLELATQCLNYRMFKQEDEHYDSLFLNKKFIGDLFLTSRHPQEDILNKTIEQWRSGFNKSVLIFGERLSGRSTFLDYTSKKYFGKNSIIIQPNSEATIDGRKFKTSNNLKEALQYIKNNNMQNTKPAIVIDDLELWRDQDISLLTNIRALINFIETESDNVFVMASTNKSMLGHLDSRLDFSNAFSILIDLSKTEKQQIVEALMLRHGAAHRTLVGEDFEPMTPKMIQKAILKLCNQYHNNLGDVLQAWTYHTFVQENEKLLFKIYDHEFPDYFSQQELMILKQASIFSIVTEFGLKRVSASGFETDFKSAVKRLINTKVLLRNNSGHLYINPVVLSDINLFINQRN